MEKWTLKQVQGDARRGIVRAEGRCYTRPMIAPPEILRVTHARNICDGATDIPGGPSLGHPRVFLEIDESGYVDCGYCDRRFVLIGGPADGVDQSTLHDHGDGAGL